MAVHYNFTEVDNGKGDDYDDDNGNMIILFDYKKW